MSDNYQAVYDAVTSSFRGTYQAIQSAAERAFDISHAVQNVEQALTGVAYDMVRPSVIYRPALSLDGNQWCALYGVDLQSGVAGFGATPSQAMEAFDSAWVAPIHKPKGG